MVAVPTHFFKVVLAERSSVVDSDAASQPDAVLGAWVLPNAPLQPDMPLTAFSVPLESLEEAAGRFRTRIYLRPRSIPLLLTSNCQWIPCPLPCAGLQLFPGFLNAERRAALDRAALLHQRQGRVQLKLRGKSPLPQLFLDPLPAEAEQPELIRSLSSAERNPLQEEGSASASSMEEGEP